MQSAETAAVFVAISVLVAASYLRVGFVPCLAPSNVLFFFPLHFSLAHALTPAFCFLWVTALCCTRQHMGGDLSLSHPTKWVGIPGAQFLLDIADRIEPELISVLCTWMHLLPKPVWLKEGHGWTWMCWEWNTRKTLGFEEGWCVCRCMRDGVNVCALAESPVLSQILVPFLLKEREELGKFYLFNVSAVCFFS